MANQANEATSRGPPMDFTLNLTNRVDRIEERVSALQGENFERRNRSGARLGGDTTSEPSHSPRTNMVLGTDCRRKEKEEGREGDGGERERERNTGREERTMRMRMHKIN